MFSLDVQQLSKSYNRQVVFSDLSFSHESGILGISGTNGSGKSTLLKCLAHLSTPKSGRILWKQNKEQLDKDDLRKHLGYAAPYLNLYDELTIYENLEFLLSVGGFSIQPTHIHSQIDQVQMKKFKHKLFKDLSTGQQQRVKLAAALIRKPSIVFFDEPGSNLDASGHALVAQLVNILRAKSKLVFLASNDPRELELCDQVITL